MMTVMAKLKIKAGVESQFQQAADKMIEYVKANEPGTQKYILLRSTNDPSEFVFYEVYSDQAAFAAHGASDAMQQFFGSVGGLLEGKPEFGMYEALGGKQ